MAASLCGIETAVAAGDEAELTLALRRLESLDAVVFSFGGIPLIYMGDELALPNDPAWADDPAHAHDNRWMHRPRMHLPAGNQSVLAYRRAHPRSAAFLSLTNFSDFSQSVDAEIIARAGLARPRVAHASTPLDAGASRFELEPWSFAWLTGA